MTPPIKAKAQADFFTMFLHGQNEMGAINRAATAKAWGLDPTEWASPFTQATVNVFPPESNDCQPRPPVVPISKPGIGPLGIGLLGAALAAGTGGLGLGIWSALRQPATQVVEKVLKGDADVTPGELIVTPP